MYLKWDETTIEDFSQKNITALYARGYVFTRVDKGVMDQTRSLRINLNQFELSSENRRVLRKTDFLSSSTTPLPLKNYHWSLGKLAKDFYDTKFGVGTFSANKIKEILTDGSKSNFNLLIKYSIQGEAIGYAICAETNEMIHYSYPFYTLVPAVTQEITNIGMGMMLKAILYAKESGKKYFYLGSAQRPTDTYKFQFAGIEWWDEREWSTDLKKLCSVLKTNIQK